MNPTKASAILSLVPEAEFILRGDELEWLDSRPQPSESEIEAEVQRLIAEHPKKVAQESRAAAYSQEADPLFFKYQVGEVTKEEWLAKREEIKTRYPYPS